GLAEARSPIPVTVLGLNTTTAVSAAANYVCALAATGGVRCWGNNDRGQLGNSNIFPQSVPGTVIGMTTALSVSGLFLHTCAVQADGSASCWGNNAAGELAAKDTLDHLTPTAVIQSFVTLQGNLVPIRLSYVVAIGTGF